MGTSQSKPSPTGGSPLVPPWADQDPPPPDQPQPDAAPGTMPAAPLQSARTAMRTYMGGGGRDAGRSAIGHYSRAFGGGGASARHARAARTGGGALAALSQAAAGQEVTPDGFNLGTLAGRPMEEAIEAIVDHFCPPGILDEDMARAAIAEALVEGLDGADVFDPGRIDDRTVVVATICFVTELVFGTIAAEFGKAADNIPPQLAIRRENDLRDLVREVSDHVATPRLQRDGGALTATQMADLVTAITAEVYRETSQW